MKTIQELCIEHGSDKTPEIGHGYALVYDQIFNSLDNSKVNSVLEVGVGFPSLMDKYVKGVNYKTGASLYVWRDYFVNANVYGIDIVPEAKIEGEPRITTLLCDSTDPRDVGRLMQQIKIPTIVVDDGSHRTTDQVKTALNILPYLKTGSLYFIEDVYSPVYVTTKLKQYKCEVFLPKEKNQLILIRVC